MTCQRSGIIEQVVAISFIPRRNVREYLEQTELIAAFHQPTHIALSALIGARCNIIQLYDGQQRLGDKRLLQRIIVSTTAQRIHRACHAIERHLLEVYTYGVHDDVERRSPYLQVG